MINKESKISLSYILAGECLSRKGVYTSADVFVKNPFTKSELFKVNKPSKTIIQPIYSKATQYVTLGTSFIQNALAQPKKPDGMNWHYWLKTPLGKVAQNWKKLSDKQKIQFHIEQYVADMGGEEFSYEII